MAKRVSKPANLSEGMLLCDSLVAHIQKIKFFARWTQRLDMKIIKLHEETAVLYDPADRNYRNTKVNDKENSYFVKKHIYSNISRKIHRVSKDNWPTFVGRLFSANIVEHVFCLKIHSLYMYTFNTTQQASRHYTIIGAGTGWAVWAMAHPEF